MTAWFAPDARRAGDLRAAMDGEFWRSDASLLGEAVQPSRSVLAEPLDYGACCDLALEHPGGRGPSPQEREAALEHLRRRFHASGTTGAAAPFASARITPLSAHHYSSAEIARMMRWWDIEANDRLALIPATADDRDHIALQLLEALDQLRHCAPELHGEALALIRDFVVVRAEDTAAIQSQAGSSFALWGAVMVNAGAQGGWPNIFRIVVHETAHTLLFAIARDEPLVLNPPDETHASPLRQDPRPMDGIYHAAFVSARECLAFDSLLCRAESSGEASEDELCAVTAMLEDSVIGFWQCAEILRSDARLSSLGAAILGECEDFMNRHFAVITE
jgi:HEXXH motif-containing protein